MKPSTSQTAPAGQPSAKPSGWRPLIMVPACFLLGAVLTGVWFKYGQAMSGRAGNPLSATTVDLLRGLNTPVELRLYSVLPAGSAPASLQEFSGRVDRLLSEFQGINDGKIRVIRNDSTSGTTADAATAAGIRPFNLDKGDACFLGITVVCGGRKDTLPELKPEWEPALEFDLARAIQQVEAAPVNPVARAQTPVSPEVTNTVIRLIPDVKGTSLEDGTRILRQAAFDEFTAAGKEMEDRLQTAEQKLSDAQSGGSEADQQAALKQLQDLQLEQGQKYKQIAARLQEELDVFQQMKAAESNAK